MTHAMLLAAGLGTRLRPVTDRLPKPTVPFLNVPLLNWSVELLRDAEIVKWTINTHHLHHTLLPLIQRTGQAIKTEFAISHEESQPLGSGGGVRTAFDRGHFFGAKTILIANADEVILPIRKNLIARLLESHHQSGAIATLLTMDHPDAGTKFGAVWTDSSGAVHGFGRDGALFSNGPHPKHYVGVIAIDASVLEKMPAGESNLLYDTLQNEIRSGASIRVFNEPLVWFETGNVADYLSATREILHLLSPTQANSPLSHARAQALRVLGAWHPGEVGFWEHEAGARALYSKLRDGSLPFTELMRVLTKEKAFAVYGDNTLAKAPLINAVSLPDTVVSTKTENTISL
ncbi:MAG: NTP transferase domain-containing protein [Bdellovibrionales bacterium]|nr:NTP transferase domain-containing protein [Bdellovibrionales bacterium]